MTEMLPGFARRIRTGQGSRHPRQSALIGTPPCGGVDSPLRRDAAGSRGHPRAVTSDEQASRRRVTSGERQEKAEPLRFRILYSATAEGRVGPTLASAT